MSLNMPDYLISLINDNRERIERLRAEMARESLSSGSAALRSRVLEQMELSLACLERNKEALAARPGHGDLGGQGV